MGPISGREAEPDRGEGLAAGVAGPASVVERALEGLLHRADLAAPPVHVREADEQAGNRRVVSGGLERRQRAVHLVGELVDAALGADEQADHHRGQPSSDRAAGVAGFLGCRDRRRVHLLRAREVADLEVRLGVVDEQRRVPRPQGRSAAKEVRGGVRVVAGERPAARPGQPLGRSFCERKLGRAGRRELQPVRVRLLEMVPENLVELRRRSRPRLDPVRAALVQVGTKALRHRVIRGVPHEDVSEAEAVLTRERAAGPGG